ncbi:VOC family protein [Microbacterium sp. DT81.1]|uniref:VOC family protein n=1 Tax=Microbacterium sp. DT81.1 TaxID=3393413 RepID=UPI003CF1DF57
MIKDDTDSPAPRTAYAGQAARSVELIRVDHVGIMVDELDPAVNWYVNALGLSVTDRWENESSGMAWAHLQAGGIRLEIVQRPGLASPTPGAAGIHHIAIVVDDCAAATAELIERGGDEVMPASYFERHDMDWSFVRDPFGNILEIVSYRSTDVPESQGGADRR